MSPAKPKPRRTTAGPPSPVRAPRPGGQPAPAEAGRLLVFVKAPRPGFVKTRLAASLGVEAATLAHTELVGVTLDRIAGSANVTLCFTPADAEAEIASWRRPGWALLPQVAGDLGRRLERAFACAFAAGAARVAAIGTDCPDLTADDLGAAWRALDSADVVLGPAADGGYWLIGLRRPQPALFDGIAWSTDRVLRQTLAIARAAGLRVRLLRELRDVDDEADWRAYRTGRLVDSRSAGPS